MQRFLVGHSNRRHASDVVDDCLRQMGDIPQKANFGFIYATDELGGSLQDVYDALKSRTGIKNWTGSLGVGISGCAREYYDQPALAVMVADFPPQAFTPIPLLRSGVDSFIAQNRNWIDSDPVHFGILHADPSNPATPTLMDRLSAGIPGAFFVGGLTSSESSPLQIANGLCSGGISGVLFSGEVQVATGHTQGCTPISKKHVITHCERNIIVSLDDQPALKVFRQDIGEVLAKDLNRIAGYIFVGMPVPNSDTGDYMVRNIMGVDIEQNLIAVGEYLQQGDEVMFCRRDGNTAQEDMLRMLADIRRRIPNSVRGAVYYSCLGRGRYQFGENSEELQLISEELGDIPLVGFFANGEIFNNRLYGYTGVLSVFY